MSEQNNQYNYANTLSGPEAEAGLEIHELDPLSREFRPAGEVLTTDAEAKALATQYVHDGHVKYYDKSEAPEVPQTFMFVDVPAEQFRKAYGENRGMVALEEPVVGEPIDGVNEIVREAVEKKVVDMVERALDRPYASLPTEIAKEMKNISQVFEVDNGKAKFRIMNFSETPLEGFKLKKMLNALREMDDVTGGTSTELVSLLTVFPEDSPFWQVDKEHAQDLGAKRKLAVAFGSSAIAFNEYLIKGDSAVEEGDINNISVGNSIESTTFHEMTHIVEAGFKNTLPAQLPSEKMGWKFERDDMGFIDKKVAPIFEGDKKNPSPYGQTDSGEDVAESSAAMFVGGEWAAMLDDERKQAIAELFADQHSGQHGPSYLRCSEIDLRRITPDSKIGSNLIREIMLKPVIQLNAKAAA